MSSLYQDTMKLRHAEKRLARARKRMEKTADAYGHACRALSGAEEVWRRERRRVEQRQETANIIKALNGQ